MAAPAETNSIAVLAAGSATISCISGTFGSSGVRISPACSSGIRVPLSILSLSSARAEFHDLDTMSTSPRSSASV